MTRRKCRGWLMIALISLLSLSMILSPVYASETDQLTVTQTVFTADNRMVTEPTAAEKFTTTATVIGEGEVYLIAALYQTSDNNLILENVAVSSRTLVSGEPVEISVDMKITTMENHSFKYFVWNANSMKPYALPDVAESTPIGLLVAGYTRRAVLQWNMPKTELSEDITYDIYRDGTLIKEDTLSGGYIDEIKEGTYTYQIKASNGNESNPCSVTVGTTETADYYTQAVVLGEDVTHGMQASPDGTTMTLIGEDEISTAVKAYLAGLTNTDGRKNAKYYAVNPTGDGYIFKETVTGEDSIGAQATKDTWLIAPHVRYQSTNPSSSRMSPGYLYLAFPEISQTNPISGAVTLCIEYLDAGTGKVTISGMKDSGGSTSTLAEIELTNTNKWITKKIALNSVYFDCTTSNMNHGTSSKYKCDIRIATAWTMPEGVHIAGVYLYMKDDGSVPGVIRQADTLYPDGISIDFSGIEADVIQNAGASTAQGVVSNGITSVYERNDGTRSYRAGTDGNPGYLQTENGNKNFSSTRGITYMYFKVDSAYLQGLSDGYVQGELTYYDDPALSGKILSLDYETLDANGAYTTKSRSITTFAGEGGIKKLTFEVNDACLVGQYTDVGSLRLGITNDNSTQFKLVSLKLRNTSHRKPGVLKTPDGIPTVYIASDSISADYATDRFRQGWGTFLPNYLTNGAEVVNYGCPGASTKTFSDWNTIYKSIDRDDYVVICFGHNDSMLSKRVPEDEFKANLQAAVKQIRAVGATPMLMTPIPSFYSTAADVNEDNWCYTSDSVDNWRQYTRDVAATDGVALVDLAKILREEKFPVMTGLEIRKWYDDQEDTDPSDGMSCVHLQTKGAQEVAKLVAQGLSASGMNQFVSLP